MGPPFDVVIKATVDGPAADRSKKVPSFLTKTMSVDLSPGIHPATSHHAVRRPTD